MLLSKIIFYVYKHYYEDSYKRSYKMKIKMQHRKIRLEWLQWKRLPSPGENK